MTRQKDRSQEVWGRRPVDHTETLTGSDRSREHVFGLAGNRSTWRNLPQPPEPPHTQVTLWRQTLLSIQLYRLGGMSGVGTTL